MARRQRDEVPGREEDIEREKGDDPLQFPGDLRPEMERDDIENEGRKPDLEEIEEDSSTL